MLEYNDANPGLTPSPGLLPEDKEILLPARPEVKVDEANPPLVLIRDAA